MNKVSFRSTNIPQMFTKEDQKDTNNVLKNHFHGQLTHLDYYASRVDEFINNKPIKNRDMKISQRLERQSKKEKHSICIRNKKRLQKLFEYQQ